MEAIPHIELIIQGNKDEIEKNAILICKHFIQNWKYLDNSCIRVLEMKGGITNKLFQCVATIEGDCEKIVLLRVYGYHTELLINRKNELQNIIELYKKGFGPKLYGTFTNGYVYQYFDGKALTPEELSNSKYIQKIGSFLGKWHRQEIIGEKISTCWEKIEEWLDLVPESYNNEEKDKKIRQLGGLCKLKKELKNLKNSLSKINSPIVFTHNDLLSGNVIFNEKNDSIYFIDFEYSGYNYRGYDIANHFNEWAGFNVDYSKYPNKEQQYEFFRSYLKSFNQTEEEPNEHELNNLYKEVNKFSLLSHFYWGVWSLIQADISDINFDFMQYALERFTQYYKIRDIYLTL